MVVEEDSEGWSKVTVPLTLESPRRTATGERRVVSFFWVYDGYGVGLREQMEKTDKENSVVL